MTAELERLPFASARAWRSWLEANHDTAPGIWLMIAKKVSGVESVTYDEAVDESLCFGWIDGQKAKHDDQYFLQRFTRRSKRSPWSRANTERVARLVKAKRMHPAGLRPTTVPKPGAYRTLPVDLGAVSGDALSVLLEEASAAVNEAEARRLAVAGEWDRRQAWADDGAYNGRCWLAERCTLSRAEAGRVLRTAKAIGAAPAVDDAVAGGGCRWPRPTCWPRWSRPAHKRRSSGISRCCSTKRPG